MITKLPQTKINPIIIGQNSSCVAPYGNVWTLVDKM